MLLGSGNGGSEVSGIGRAVTDDAELACVLSDVHRPVPRITEASDVVALGNGTKVWFEGRGTGQGTGVTDTVGLAGVEVASSVSFAAGDKVISPDKADGDADVMLRLGKGGLVVKGGLAVIFSEMEKML